MSKPGFFTAIMDTYNRPSLLRQAVAALRRQTYENLDYAAKMVALFEGNPTCTTAAGLSVSIDLGGNRIETEIRTSNFRPRYMDGRLLALDLIRGGQSMFSSPGTIFTIKRDLLLKAGGYHRQTEQSQVYGIVPFGVTGFDETALFYWRRHQGQLSKELEAVGYSGVGETVSLIRDWDLERRWQVFGAVVAQEVVNGLKSSAEASAAARFAYHLRLLNPSAAYRVAGMFSRYPGFWRRLPLAIWHPVREPLMPVRLLTKAFLRAPFAVMPRTWPLPQKLEELRARVTH